MGLFQILESHSIENIESEAAAKAELIKQKEEMILCLQVVVPPVLIKYFFTYLTIKHNIFSKCRKLRVPVIVFFLELLDLNNP